MDMDKFILTISCDGVEQTPLPIPRDEGSIWYPWINIYEKNSTACLLSRSEALKRIEARRDGNPSLASPSLFPAQSKDESDEDEGMGLFG